MARPEEAGWRQIKIQERPQRSALQHHEEERCFRCIRCIRATVRTGTLGCSKSGQCILVVLKCKSLIDWHSQMRVDELHSGNSTKWEEGVSLAQPNKDPSSSAQCFAKALAARPLSRSRPPSLAWKGRSKRTRSDSNNRQRLKRAVKHAGRA